jgi:hypothetical protein
MAHELFLLGLPGVCIQGLLQVLPDSQAPQAIGALPNRMF